MAGVKKTAEERMRMITLHLPRPIVDLIDEIKDAGYCPNRGEYIRNAVINQLKADRAWIEAIHTRLDTKREEIDGA